MNPPTVQSARRACCSDACDDGLRNNYYKDKPLTVDSFRVEQKYSLERRRLINRAIHGWGVVYGYAIDRAVSDGAEAPALLKIGAGLALDKHGCELVETGARLTQEALIFLDRNGRPADRDKVIDEHRLFRHDQGRMQRTHWLLSVHYAERPTAPVMVGHCRCERDEWDLVCETVRYSLRPVPESKCHEAFPCELNCSCQEGLHDARLSEAEESQPHQRGGHECLCKHLTQLVPGAGAAVLCQLEEPCGTVAVDVKHGVPLACITFEGREDRLIVETIEACGPRRLVKRNDLLYDLIRGCDLTHISEISWAKWHRGTMEFQKFNEFFGPEGEEQKEQPTGFEVQFSRPVRKDTLKPDCVTMTVITSQGEGGWWLAQKVPVLGFVPVDSNLGLDQAVAHTDRAMIVVDGLWVVDALRLKTIFEEQTRVEIEIRGDFILDCNGQALDANAVGLSPVPTGNGTLGGTFLSTFLVQPRQAAARWGGEVR